MELDNMQANNILDAVFSWSKKQDFRGHNKHDGLNSPILRLLLGWAKWPRIIAIQTVMRSPINIRSLLGVPKTTNPKGLALFVLGLLDRFQTEGKQCHLDEAVLLLEKLYSVQSPGKHSGACWGYPYPWQDLGFLRLPIPLMLLLQPSSVKLLLLRTELQGRKNTWRQSGVHVNSFSKI